MATKIIEKNYYIIKVSCNNGKKVYYKIGEAINKSRPESLVEKYRKLRSNDAELLLFDKLPHNEKMRLNDKEIHKHIDSNILKHADPIYVEHFLEEIDGKEEFFEATSSSIDVVNYIKKLIISLSKKCYYTVNNIFDKELTYDPDKYHLVDANILNIIFSTYHNVFDVIYRDIKNSILFIGQFDHDFIASIAMFHNVYLWHDSVEQMHEYSFSNINHNITYINSLGELLEMKEINFDIIISNPPYGKIGDEITCNIIDEVGFSKFVNLLPLKDYTLETGMHIDFTSMTTLPPHSFSDADILTHIVEIKKEKVNYFSSQKELCAASYIVDKPFSKFMKANELRNHYAIDSIHTWKPTCNIESSFVFHHLATKSQHTCGFCSLASDTASNKWNLKNIDVQNNGRLWGVDTVIEFNSALEKNSFIQFYKENTNFLNRMIANQFIAIRDHAACFPKVDWTREWTVEEILKEVANYTDDEVKEVLDTMDKDYCIGKDTDIERLFGEYLK